MTGAIKKDTQKNKKKKGTYYFFLIYEKRFHLAYRITRESPPPMMGTLLQILYTLFCKIYLITLLLLLFLSFVIDEPPKWNESYLPPVPVYVYIIYEKRRKELIHTKFRNLLILFTEHYGKFWRLCWSKNYYL